MANFLDKIIERLLTIEEQVFVQNLAGEADYDSTKVLLGLENTLSGTIDGVNTVFTCTHIPKMVIADGTIRISGYGYLITGSGPYTITFDSLIPPTQFVKIIY